MKKIFIIIFVAVCILIKTCTAEAALMVNWEEVKPGETRTIYSTNLINSEIIFAVPMSHEVDSAEISLDNGYMWSDMTEGNQNFIFRYVPVDGDELKILLRENNKDGTSEDINTNATVIYHQED